MSVKIRLTRRGRKKLALFDVIISDSRSSRDGKFIEKIGVYNPNTNPATIELNEDKAFDWLMKGAQPTDTVKAMLSYKGIMFRKHLQIGVNKGALSQEEADRRIAEWKDAKINKIENKKTKLATDKAKSIKDKHEAESKVNAAREETLKTKNKVVEAEVAVEETPAPAEEVVAAPVAVEAVAAEEAPVAVAAPETEAPAAE